MRPIKRYTKENNNPDTHIGDPTLTIRWTKVATGAIQRSLMPSLRSTRALRTQPRSVLMVVPHAAPATPSCGNGPRPQMSTGSKRMFRSTVAVVMPSACFRSPTPRIPAVSTAPTASGSAPTMDA